MNTLRMVLATTLSVALVPVAPAGAFELKNGDSVVFMGDTMTAVSGYPDLIENFVRVRYPDLDLRFFTSGWGNETAAKGVDRLDRDILSLKPTPTVAVVGYGMHDGAVKAYDEMRYKECEEALAKIIDKLEGAGCRVWLLTPMSIEEELAEALAKVHYNEVLGRYADGIVNLGEKHGVKVIDLYQLSMEGRLKHRQHDRRFNYHSPRRLAPEPIVGVLVATEVLKAWSAEPLTMDLRLDWKANKATISSGKVEVDAVTDQERLINITDMAMPWPRIIGKNELPAPYWPMAELSRLTLWVENCPGSGLLLGTVERGLPLLQMQLEEAGIDLARYEPLRSRADMDTLAKLIRHKNLIRTRKWWEEVDLRRTDQPELQKAQDLMGKAMEAYVLGYRDWINTIPRTVDVTLRLTEITPELIRARNTPPPSAAATRRAAPATRGAIGQNRPRDRGRRPAATQAAPRRGDGTIGGRRRR